VLWELPTKDQILADQSRKLRYLFEQLAVTGSRAMVDRYVTTPVRHRPAPASLRAAVPAG
jgi:hypothetical protein